MGKGRLEAFSDGVIAVIITIMVLELKAPHGTDLPALAHLVPALLSYVLSFVFVGIYWNNHHHMLHAAQHIDGRVLWANLHLLFWLSLVPFTTGWVGEHPAAAIPTAIYGGVFLMSGFAWLLLHDLVRSRSAHRAEHRSHPGLTPRPLRHHRWVSARRSCQAQAPGHV